MIFATLEATDSVQALRRLDIEELLLPVLIQLVVIIIVARVFGLLFRAVGQPTVVGEILAGILMGPSLFGALFPETFSAVFQPDLPGISAELAAAAFPKIFQVLAQLGLIFLLFLIGLEFDFGHLRARGKSAVAICVVGTGLPFLLGAGIAPLIHPHLEPHPNGRVVPLFGMTLFLGTALSITALPILGRMMIEMGITRTKLATVVITAAAVGDVIGWVMLATVAALAKVGTGGFDPWQTVAMIGQTILFAVVVMFFVRPLLCRYFSSALRMNGGELSLTSLAVLLVSLLLSALVTNMIGIFAIFGAFILGAILSDQPELRRAAGERIRAFVTALFLPIVFTYTGLRTEISTLNSLLLWLICVAVIAAALTGKFLGCAIAARITGFNTRESAIIGIMMNTRALMELIVINVGYDLGVIPQSLFCMLVIMAVLTTLITSPIILAFRRGTELEEPIAQSGFLSPCLAAAPIVKSTESE